MIAREDSLTELMRVELREPSTNVVTPRVLNSETGATNLGLFRLVIGAAFLLRTQRFQPVANWT